MLRLGLGCCAYGNRLPFYLSDKDKEARRYDQNISGNVTLKNKTVKQLKKDLQDAGVSLPLGRFKLADCQALACQYGLENTTEKGKIFLAGKEDPKVFANTLGAQVD